MNDAPSGAFVFCFFLSQPYYTNMPTQKTQLFARKTEESAPKAKESGRPFH